MLGIGPAEMLIIAAFALLVLGAPALLGFWFGYQAGKRADETTADASTTAAPSGQEEHTDD